jgi:protein-tyrosine kinase
MAKTYEALLRSEEERAVYKKRTALAEPVQEPRKEEPKKGSGPRKEARNIFPEIGLQNGPTASQAYHERTTMVLPVSPFISQLDSPFTEQLRKVRGTIITHHKVHKIRSIVVTSCMPEEGKTTVALNLSATIATGLDHSAILIDADLRRSTLTSLLGLENSLGLSDVLKERASIEEVMIRTEIEGLAIVPSGSHSLNPSELIGSRRMKSLIEQLRGTCKDSYIIIDSTPVFSTSEANSLSQMTDGVILVIMADKTRRDVVKREVEAISSEKILGVVLNCAEFETSGYYYNYYKYYGKRKE